MSAHKELLQKKYEGVSHLMKSKEWAYWVDFLKGREAHFQNVINLAVENGDLLGAQKAKVLMDDSMKQIELFTGKLNKLGEQIKEKK